jgi:hypothetical protein
MMSRFTEIPAKVQVIWRGEWALQATQKLLLLIQRHIFTIEVEFDVQDF